MKSAIELDAGQRAFVRWYGPPRPTAAQECAAWARKNRAMLDAEWDALPDVPRTIEAHLVGFKGDEA